MYDPVIYQIYNVFMTSLPIVWFTMYDYKYTKEDDKIDLIPLPYPVTDEEKKERDDQVKKIRQKDKEGFDNPE